MKGIIFSALNQVVEEKFGLEMWESLLEEIQPDSDGIYLSGEGYPDEELFAFVGDCGKTFLPAYLPIVERRRNLEYGEKERQFQLYRRGRYVEFNLVYDRGTIFGLQTNGRTESILMSLPPLVRWEYSYEPKVNTPEFELYKTFLKPQDWVNWL